LQTLIDHTQETVNGWVRIKLYKGNVIVVSRDSKTDSLFDMNIATFDEDGGAYNQADAVRGLEAFSHLWILFVFHQTMEGGWRPTVRPPRLGGNARMGVFATRSTFRPNPIGMSLVELKEVVCHKDSVILKLGSLDLVDGTPVVDIKPYLPFAESLPDASASYAQSAPAAEMAVSFTAEVEKQLLTLEKRYPQLTLFIREVVAQDPRPAYRKGEETGKTYAVWLHDFNVRSRVPDPGFEVFALEPR
ncbi:tRNA (N6-threonylcarbamoyladenosine(37)-N6)-methyltransferase TrmO, partial [Streptococcus danieliae]|nr:tRNA (N6-threonylcarbamoyladenosine(37)-N6)-methyltransferase TrmO [Streptococcus danieliae]